MAFPKKWHSSFPQFKEKKNTTAIYFFPFSFADPFLYHSSNLNVGPVLGAKISSFLTLLSTQGPHTVPSLLCELSHLILTTQPQNEYYHFQMRMCISNDLFFSTTFCESFFKLSTCCSYSLYLLSFCSREFIYILQCHYFFSSLSISVFF